MIGLDLGKIGAAIGAGELAGQNINDANVFGAFQANQQALNDKAKRERDFALQQQYEAINKQLADKRKQEMMTDINKSLFNFELSDNKDWRSVVDAFNRWEDISGETWNIDTPKLLISGGDGSLVLNPELEGQLSKLNPELSKYFRKPLPDDATIKVQVTGDDGRHTEKTINVKDYLDSVRALTSIDSEGRVVDNKILSPETLVTGLGMGTKYPLYKYNTMLQIDKLKQQLGKEKTEVNPLIELTRLKSLSEQVRNADEKHRDMIAYQDPQTGKIVKGNDIPAYAQALATKSGMAKEYAMDLLTNDDMVKRVTDILNSGVVDANTMRTLVPELKRAEMTMDYDLSENARKEIGAKISSLAQFNKLRNDLLGDDKAKATGLVDNLLSDINKWSGRQDFESLDPEEKLAVLKNIDWRSRAGTASSMLLKALSGADVPQEEYERFMTNLFGGDMDWNNPQSIASALGGSIDVLKQNVLGDINSIDPTRLPGTRMSWLNRLNTGDGSGLNVAKGVQSRPISTISDVQAGEGGTQGDIFYTKLADTLGLGHDAVKKLVSDGVDKIASGLDEVQKTNVDNAYEQYMPDGKAKTTEDKLAELANANLKASTIGISSYNPIAYLESKGKDYFDDTPPRQIVKDVLTLGFESLIGGKALKDANNVRKGVGNALTERAMKLKSRKDILNRIDEIETKYRDAIKSYRDAKLKKGEQLTMDFELDALSNSQIDKLKREMEALEKELKIYKDKLPDDDQGRINSLLDFAIRLKTGI